jgi:hemoglobin
MHDAVQSLSLPADREARLWDYLVYAAHSLVNA